MNTKYCFYSIVIAMALVVSPALQAETWKEFAWAKYSQAKKFVTEKPVETTIAALTSVGALIGARLAFKNRIKPAVQETKGPSKTDPATKPDDSGDDIPDSDGDTKPPQSPRPPDNSGNDDDDDANNANKRPSATAVNHRPSETVIFGNANAANEQIERSIAAAAATATTEQEQKLEFDDGADPASLAATQNNGNKPNATAEQ